MNKNQKENYSLQVIQKISFSREQNTEMALATNDPDWKLGVLEVHSHLKPKHEKFSIILRQPLIVLKEQQ